MYLDSTKKVEIFTQYGQGSKDTGSAAEPAHRQPDF